MVKSCRSLTEKENGVMSKGIKGLEKRIREDKAIATAIRKLRESLTRNRNQFAFS